MGRLLRSFPILVFTVVCFLIESATAETIIIRSGTSGTTPLAPGTLWTAAHSLVAPKPNVAAFPLPFGFFSVGFIQACAVSSPSPRVITPAAGWVQTIPFAPSARWVSHNTFTGNDQKPGRSALLCIPFNVTTQVIGSAILKFSWACDDRLGDPAGGPNVPGVYVNHGNCGISGGSFSTVTSLKKDVTLLVHPGTNHLHVYLRDTLGTNSGVIFSAVITVCPPGNGQLDVVVRSGSVGGSTGSSGQSSDAKCFRGDERKALKKLKFHKCDDNTFVRDLGQIWPLPTNGDPTCRWIFWKRNNGNPAPVSALVRQPFYIPWAVSSAQMTFGGTGDDRLGDDVHTDGVYIDQVGQNITATSLSLVTPQTRTVSVALGWHHLWVYVRDTLNFHAGAFYNATFHLVGGKPCSSINDPEDLGNPAPISVFPVGPGHVGVAFDRDISLASAGNIANFQVGQGVTIVDAMLGLDGQSALLTIASDAGSGTLANLTVSGIVAADTMLVQTQPGTMSFYPGLQSIQFVQSPDPVALGQCVDRSRLAGLDSLPGSPVAIGGICVGRALDCYALIDTTATSRSGVLISGSGVEMERGVRYEVTGRVMESEGETVLMDIMDVSEVYRSLEPAPITRPLSVFRRIACDVSQTAETGEDFEGMLVRVGPVNVLRGLQNGSLSVKAARGTSADTLTVCGVDSTFSGVPQPGDQIVVTGLLVFRDGRFQIAPRDIDDFTGRSATIDPNTIKPTVFPFPGNPSVTIAFHVPRPGLVEITIYDVRGGLVRRLTDRSLVAGSHQVVWKGDNDGGATVPSGVYFYRLNAPGVSEAGKIMILK